MGQHHHEQAIQFIKGVVALMDVGLDATRVGMIAYAYHPDLEFDLDEFSTLEALEQAIGGVKYERGATYTGAALKRAQTLFDPDSSEGARSDVRQILVLITGMRTARASICNRSFP